MKKLTIFHTEFFFSGGAEHTLLETIDFLQQKGFQVTGVAPYVNKSTCFPEIISKYPINSLLPGWFIKLSLPREVYLIIAGLLSPFLVLKFKDSDVYYGANQAGPFFAYIASRINKKPYIVYMPYPQGFLYPRKIDKEFGEQSDLNSFTKIVIKIIKPIFRKIDTLIMKHAKTIITEGEYALHVFENIYKRDCINCPPGATPLSCEEINETDRFSGICTINGKNIPKPYILLTNRHMPKKKFEYAICALELVKKKENCTAKLVITGSPTEYTNTLINLIKEKNLESQIIFSGYTTEIDTHLLYKNASLYIYTAPEEDFGKGLIQAMACGVPVIAWNNAGPSGIIKDNLTGYAVTPFNLEEFSEKIYKLSADMQLNKKMGINALNDSISRFSIEKHNTKILDVITQAMK